MSATFSPFYECFIHRRRIKIEEKAKVVTSVWGAYLIQFLATLAIFHQDILKKRLNRILALEKWMIIRLTTIPNHHTTKMDVLLKTLIQTILVAKWFVQHSNMFPHNRDDL